MVDYTDDWMNPKPSTIWKHEKPKNQMQYYIEREKRVICFGSPGSIRQWDLFSRHYDTKEERDKEFDYLRKNYPNWHIRKAQRNPYMDDIMRRCG